MVGFPEIQGALQPVIARFLSQKNALERMRARDVEIATFIDLGAAEGGWSTMARQVYPDAHCHLVEANAAWQPALEKRCAAPGFSYSLAAIGPHDGTGYYPASVPDPYGGRAFVDAGPDRVAVDMVTVDTLVARHGLEPPFCVKMDIHGLEREVLAGARGTLARTSLVINEMVAFSDAGRYLPELMLDLSDRGFRVADLAEPAWRPKDMLFWQVDMFFLPNDHPRFADRGWK